MQVQQRLGHALALGGRGAARDGLLGTGHSLVQVCDARADLHLILAARQCAHQVGRLHELAVKVIVAANGTSGLLAKMRQ